jgi:hypothetical protein
MIRRAMFVLMAALPVAVQAQFEGTVTMTVTGNDGTPRSMSYMVKDGKIRFDPAGRGGNAPVSVILDTKGDQATLIMNAQRMYMQRAFPSIAASVQQQAAAKHPAIAHTGKKETIAGYTCEHVTATDDDGNSVDVCMSTELGGFRMPGMSNPMSPSKEPDWITQLGAGAFPLKVQKNGKTLMEVTAIDKKPLDASLFEPPAGYQSFSMPMPKKPK